MSFLELITPAGMTFVFRMRAGECHKKLTGICSLERDRPDRTKDTGDESDYDFCPKLLKSLTGGKFPVRIARKMPVDIIQYNCGHWQFNDGQHRTCIAKRKNLSFEAEVSTLSTKPCGVCAGKISDSAEVW
jgi:hypothetical protein